MCKTIDTLIITIKTLLSESWNDMSEIQFTRFIMVQRDRIIVISVNKFDCRLQYREISVEVIEKVLKIDTNLHFWTTINFSTETTIILYNVLKERENSL